MKIYVKLVEVSKTEYVQSLTPYAKTGDVSKACKWELDTDNYKPDEIDNTLIKALEIASSNEGKIEWTFEVYNDKDEKIAWLLINKAMCNLNVSKTVLSDPDTIDVLDYLKQVAIQLSDALIEMVMRGITKPVSAATSEETDAPVKHPTGTVKSDIDAIVDSIAERTKAEIVKPSETLKDYVCDPLLKEELEEIKDFFENASVYKSAGVALPKGILFKGAPGTGKTYAARCIAGSVDCYFMTCTASSLQGMYIGSGAENIRAIFKGAKQLHDASKKGVILFIDEIDSFGSRDSHGNNAGGEEDRTLNQLLAEISGFEETEGIMLLAATNYPQRLDDALTRSGRFSRQITFEMPDEDERKAMLDYYYGKIHMPLEGTNTLELTSLTEGMTPADIKEISNESAILSIRQHLSNIPLGNVNEAVNKVLTKNIRHPDGKLDIHMISAHECGHVLAEWLTANKLPIKVTSYSYGDAGGFTQSSVDNDSIPSREAYTARVYELLGGRAAEQALLGYITTGASNDLERAKRKIRNYYEVYHFEPYEAEKLEQKVLDTLNEWYKNVVDMFSVTKNFKILQSLTDELCKSRVLYTKDIAAIISREGGVI